MVPSLLPASNRLQNRAGELDRSLAYNTYSDMTYDREIALKDQFNQFFEQFGIVDLYSELSNNQLISLKKLLSCINNMITLRATDSFVLKIYQDGLISGLEKDAIWKDVHAQHANTNGFDVHFESKRTKIIAEIKCNIPVNGTSFGAAQEEGILDDIDHLLHGKAKANIADISAYYKFMVILDCEHAKESMDKIIHKTEHVKRYTFPNELDTNNVFVIYV